MHETALWGIHAGRHAEADPLFLRENRIAIGWGEIGDLKKLPATRDAFKAEVASFWTKEKQQATINWASQLYRFVHEMKLGDLVAYPSKVDHEIHVGRVEGEYEFVATPNHMYENRRRVNWIVSCPRKQFSQGALYEIGSALSLFRIKRYADEFFAIAGDTPSKKKIVPESDDARVAPGTEYFEETTREFILDRLAQQTKGYPFQDFVADILRTMGYLTRISPVGTDQGIDIVARKDELELEPRSSEFRPKVAREPSAIHRYQPFTPKLGVTSSGYSLQWERLARRPNNSLSRRRI